MTQQQILDAALARLGAATVAASATWPAGTNSPEMTAAIASYPLTRDRLLRSHPWNFAKTRVEITADATAPAFRWAYRHAIPAGCLRVLKVNGHAEDEPDREWEVEGTWILCNDAKAQTTFIQQITDTTKFDPLFTQALIVLLASEIAGQITRGQDMRAGFLEEYERIVAPLARRVDANERTERGRLNYFDSDLVRSRMGFGN